MGQEGSKEPGDNGVTGNSGLSPDDILHPNLLQTSVASDGNDISAATVDSEGKTKNSAAKVGHDDVLSEYDKNLTSNEIQGQNFVLLKSKIICEEENDSKLMADHMPAMTDKPMITDSVLISLSDFQSVDSSLGHFTDAAPEIISAECNVNASNNLQSISVLSDSESPNNDVMQAGVPDPNVGYPTGMANSVSSDTNQSPVPDGSNSNPIDIAIETAPIVSPDPVEAKLISEDSSPPVPLGDLSDTVSDKSDILVTDSIDACTFPRHFEGNLPTENITNASVEDAATDVLQGKSDIQDHWDSFEEKNKICEEAEIIKHIHENELNTDSRSCQIIEDISPMTSDAVARSPELPAEGNRKDVDDIHLAQFEKEIDEKALEVNNDVVVAQQECSFVPTVTLSDEDFNLETKERTDIEDVNSLTVKDADLETKVAEQVLVREKENVSIIDLHEHADTLSDDISDAKEESENTILPEAKCILVESNEQSLREVWPAKDEDTVNIITKTNESESEVVKVFEKIDIEVKEKANSSSTVSETVQIKSENEKSKRTENKDQAEADSEVKAIEVFHARGDKKENDNDDEEDERSECILQENIDLMNEDEEINKSENISKNGDDKTVATVSAKKNLEDREETTENISQEKIDLVHRAIDTSLDEAEDMGTDEYENVSLVGDNSGDGSVETVSAKSNKEEDDSDNKKQEISGNISPETIDSVHQAVAANSAESKDEVVEKQESILHERDSEDGVNDVIVAEVEIDKIISNDKKEIMNGKTAGDKNDSEVRVMSIFPTKSEFEKKDDEDKEEIRGKSAKKENYSEDGIETIPAENGDAVTINECESKVVEDDAKTISEAKNAMTNEENAAVIEIESDIVGESAACKIVSETDADKMDEGDEMPQVQPDVIENDTSKDIPVSHAEDPGKILIEEKGKTESVVAENQDIVNQDDPTRQSNALTEKLLIAEVHVTDSDSAANYPDGASGNDCAVNRTGLEEIRKNDESDLPSNFVALSDGFVAKVQTKVDQPLKKFMETTNNLHYHGHELNESCSSISESPETGERIGLLVGSNNNTGICFSRQNEGQVPGDKSDASLPVLHQEGHKGENAGLQPEEIHDSLLSMECAASQSNETREADSVNSKGLKPTVQERQIESTDVDGIGISAKPPLSSCDAAGFQIDAKSNASADNAELKNYPGNEKPSSSISDMKLCFDDNDPGSSFCNEKQFASSSAAQILSPDSGIDDSQEVEVTSIEYNSTVNLSCVSTGPPFDQLNLLEQHLASRSMSDCISEEATIHDVASDQVSPIQTAGTQDVLCTASKTSSQSDPHSTAKDANQSEEQELPVGTAASSYDLSFLDNLDSEEDFNPFQSRRTLCSSPDLVKPRNHAQAQCSNSTAGVEKKVGVVSSKPASSGGHVLKSKKASVVAKTRSEVSHHKQL